MNGSSNRRDGQLPANLDRSKNRGGTRKGGLMVPNWNAQACHLSLVFLSETITFEIEQGALPRIPARTLDVKATIRSFRLGKPQAKNDSNGKSSKQHPTQNSRPSETRRFHLTTATALGVQHRRPLSTDSSQSGSSTLSSLYCATLGLAVMVHCRIDPRTTLVVHLSVLIP